MRHYLELKTLIIIFTIISLENQVIRLVNKQSQPNLHVVFIWKDLNWRLKKVSGLMTNMVFYHITLV